MTDVQRKNSMSYDRHVLEDAKKHASFGELATHIITWTSNMSCCAASGSPDMQEQEDIRLCRAKQTGEQHGRSCFNPTCVSGNTGAGGHCGLCYKAWYCGFLCQKKHWSAHRGSCVSCRIAGPFMCVACVPDDCIKTAISQPLESTRMRALWFLVGSVRDAIRQHKALLFSAQPGPESAVQNLDLCRLCQRLSLCHVWLGLPTQALKWLDRATRHYVAHALAPLHVHEAPYKDRWVALPKMVKYAQICAVLCESHKILDAMRPLGSFRRRQQMLHMMHIHEEKLEAGTVGILSDLEIFRLVFAFYEHNKRFLMEYGELHHISPWVDIAQHKCEQLVQTGDSFSRDWVLEAMLKMTDMVKEESLFAILH